MGGKREIESTPDGMTAPWRDMEQGSPVLKLRIPLYVLDALRRRAAERGVSPLTVACELLKAAVEDDVA